MCTRGSYQNSNPGGGHHPTAPSNTRGGGQTLRVRDAARTCTIGGPFGRGLVRIQTQLRLRRPRNHRGYHLNQYALDHMHSAGPNQWPAEQGRVEPRRPRVAQYTFVPVESRAGSGSARSRLPDGESPSRPRAELLVKEWHAEKRKLGKADLDAHGRQAVCLLYTSPSPRD